LKERDYDLTCQIKQLPHSSTSPTVSDPYQNSSYFFARAGADNPLLNESLDKFITKALANNLYVDVYNHPTGHHAFDLFDANKRTRDIVKKTLDFLQSILL
jgi:hypothetical protein